MILAITASCIQHNGEGIKKKGPEIYAEYTESLHDRVRSTGWAGGLLLPGSGRVVSGAVSIPSSIFKRCTVSVVLFFS